VLSAHQCRSVSTTVCCFSCIWSRVLCGSLISWKILRVLICRLFLAWAHLYIRKIWMWQSSLQIYFCAEYSQRYLFAPEKQSASFRIVHKLFQFILRTHIDLLNQQTIRIKPLLLIVVSCLLSDQLQLLYPFLLGLLFYLALLINKMLMLWSSFSVEIGQSKADCPEYERKRTIRKGDRHNEIEIVIFEAEINHTSLVHILTAYDYFLCWSQMPFIFSFHP